MGKVVRAIVGIGAVAAGVVLGNPKLIQVGAVIGLSALQKTPKASKAALDRLQASIDPNAKRLIVFGRTAMGTDIRYDAQTGPNQEFYHMIMVHAAHRVTSIEEIYFNGKPAWINGVVQGEFVDYLTVTPILEGTAANAVNIDNVWNAANGMRLTGCAYSHIRFKRTGNSKKSESPFATNVPTDIVVVGKGIAVYDPSKDSTVPGGSGTHRANNQATWEYASGGVDIGRNNALCELTYKLGWRINNVVSVGRGIPPEFLDLAGYITAKNDCNETVTLAGGGSEPRYRLDGVYSEGEGGREVLLSIRNSMNAIEIDDMGPIGIMVTKNDLGTPVIAFDDADILDGVSWEPYPNGVEEFRNIGRGKYTDARPESLFKLLDFPEISSPALGGIDRVLSEDFPEVQSSSQAQRLIKQKLQRLRYPGIFKANFGTRGYAVKIGSVVTLTFAPKGWANKLFRVIERGVPYDGRVPITLREEHASIYAWQNEDTPPVTPVTPTPFNFMNDPIIAQLSTIDTGATNNQLLLSGQGKDGEYIAFPQVYGFTPRVELRVGGVVGATAGRKTTIKHENLTGAGFGIVAQEEVAVIGATITDAGATATGSSPQFTINRTNAGNPYDGKWRFEYSVTVPPQAPIAPGEPGEPGLATVTLWLRFAVGWLAVHSIDHDATVANMVQFVDYTGVAFDATAGEFGLSVSDVGGTGATAVFHNVQYTLGSVTTASLANTPESFVSYEVFAK